MEENLSGGSLYDYIRSQPPLAEETCARFMWQVASAVDYLHGISMAHLALHPERVLFDGQGELKLIEFGRACLGEESQAHGDEDPISCRPPECLKPGVSSPLPRDMWALGNILYFLLTRKMPFEEITSEEVLKERLARADIFYPREISEQARNLLMKLLTASPVSRLTISDVLEHPWMVSLCPVGYPLHQLTTEINEVALKKMSATFKVDRQFHQTMIDSLIANQKNWLTAK